MKPVPVTEAELTVTGPVPEEVRVSDWEPEALTLTLPKLRAVVLSVSFRVAAVPVPLNETVAVLPVEELLLMVRLPVADPDVVGLNWTCMVSDWPGFNVAGSVTATMEKPVPAIEAELTVKGAVPEEVSVTACVVEEFTVTLPKLNELALRLNCGFVAAAPVPLNDTVFMPPLVELLIVSFPLTDPAVWGANCTVSVSVWLGFNVAGRLPPTMLKPEPVIEAEFTVTGC